MPVYSMEGYEDPEYDDQGICQRCGTFVGSQDIHNHWHRQQVELMLNISNAVSDLMEGVPVHLSAIVVVEGGDEDADSRGSGRSGEDDPGAATERGPSVASRHPSSGGRHPDRGWTN